MSARSMATLKAVSAILIDIHGQHEHQSLLYKKNHLAIVDAFAGEETKKQKEKVAETWQQYKGKIRELSEAGTNGSERAKELAFLKFEVDEIVRAELKEHEDEELESCYRRMCNGKKIADKKRLQDTLKKCCGMLPVYGRRWGKCERKAWKGTPNTVGSCGCR